MIKLIQFMSDTLLLRGGGTHLSELNPHAHQGIRINHQIGVLVDDLNAGNVPS